MDSFATPVVFRLIERNELLGEQEHGSFPVAVGQSLEVFSRWGENLSGGPAPVTITVREPGVIEVVAWTHCVMRKLPDPTPRTIWQRIADRLGL